MSADSEPRHGTGHPSTAANAKAQGRKDAKTQKLNHSLSSVGWIRGSRRGREIIGLAGLCLFQSVSGPLAAHAEIVILNQPVEARTNQAEGITVPAPADGTGAIRPETIDFLNGDKLQGSFLSIDPKRGVRWRHPAMKQPIDINLASLAKVKLERPRSTNAHAKQSCRIRLVNQDELQGEMVSFDTEHLTLATWYAGTLVIPRQLVDVIVPGQGQGTSIFEGPTTLDGWTMRGGGARRGVNAAGPWRYANGAFTSTASGSIGRNFQLPPLVKVDFEVSWRRYMQFALSIFTDNLESYGGNGYMFQFNNLSVYLQRMSRNGDASSFGQTELPGFSQKSKARFSIRANKEQKTLFLLVDGALVKQWTDTAAFSPGSGVLFFQQGQSYVKISDIRISEWDGKFENPAAAAAAQAKEDVVTLVNADKVTGTLKAIKAGKMSLETSFATLDVPMERVTQIELAGTPGDNPKPAPGEIRAVFAEGGSVTLQIERWDDRQVVASSPSFGKAKFAPLAFSAIQFNLDKRKAEAEPNETDELGAGEALFTE